MEEEKLLRALTLTTLLVPHVALADQNLPNATSHGALIDQRMEEAQAIGEDLESRLEILRQDRKSTRLNSSHVRTSRMPSSA